MPETHQRVSLSTVFKWHIWQLTTIKNIISWCFLIHHDGNYLPRWHMWRDFHLFGVDLILFFIFYFFSFLLNFYARPFKISR